VAFQSRLLASRLIFATEAGPCFRDFGKGPALSSFSEADNLKSPLVSCCHSHNPPWPLRYLLSSLPKAPKVHPYIPEIFRSGSVSALLIILGRTSTIPCGNQIGLFVLLDYSLLLQSPHSLISLAPKRSGTLFSTIAYLIPFKNPMYKRADQAIISSCDYCRSPHNCASKWRKTFLSAD